MPLLDLPVFSITFLTVSGKNFPHKMWKIRKRPASTPPKKNPHLLCTPVNIYPFLFCDGKVTFVPFRSFPEASYNPLIEF